MARTSIGVAIIAVTMLAGCGAGSGGTPGPAASTVPGGGGPTAGPGEGGPTAGPGATSGSGPGGPSAVAEPCSYLTADEVLGIVGGDPAQQVTVTPAVREVVTCHYRTSSGDVQLDFVAKGEQLLQMFVDDDSTVESVQDLGDRAIWSESAEKMLFMIGDLLVYVQASAEYGHERETALAIATIVATRMRGGTVDPGLIPTPPPVVSAQTACDLVTAEEAAAVLDLGAISASSSEISPQFCTYSVVSSSSVVLTVYLQRLGGGATWDSLVGSLVTEPMTGIGDKALFEPSTSILFVLQGDALFNVNILIFDTDPAALRAQSKELAQVALGHL